MQQLMNAPKKTLSATYKLWFELCVPNEGKAVGLFQTHHGELDPGHEEKWWLISQVWLGMLGTGT